MLIVIVALALRRSAFTSGRAGRNDRIVYEHAQVTGNIWMATLRVSAEETASR